MADFVDDEAAETSEEEEKTTSDDEDAGHRQKKKKKPVRIDDDDEEDDEDELDEAAIKELADFIQDEAEPVEEEEVRIAEKRKRSDDEEEEDQDIDEEDYDLIEENLGIQIRRNKHRRVRPVEAGDSDDDGETNDRDAIANKLFDNDDDENPSEAPQGKRFEDRSQRMQAQQADEEIGEDDEDFSDTDSFIVGDDGEPIHGHQNRKRGPRRHEDAAMQEAQEIFGLDFDVEDLEENEDEDDEDAEYEDEDEDGEIVKRPRRKKTRKSIMDVYEPSDLEHNLRTHHDTEIRLADIPERFQLRSIPVESPPEDRAATELQDEARWIYGQLVEQSSMSNQDRVKLIVKMLCGQATQADAPTDAAKDSVEPVDKEKTDAKISKIKDILDFIRNQFLEDRFIATYRKEYYQPDFNEEDLLNIYLQDLRYMELQDRRLNLIKMMTKTQEYLRRRRLENPELFEEADELPDETIDMVRNATTINELVDLVAEFKMIFSRHLPSIHKAAPKKPLTNIPEESATPLGDVTTETAPELSQDGEVAVAASVKRARRTDPYILCKEAGLDQFVSKFGLTAELFAKNCEAEWLIHQPEQHQLDPETVAEGLVSARFPAVSDVLAGAVYMMAALIAKNSHFRRVARKQFYRRAVVYVEPTARGLKEIDENHPCYSFKWLDGKPVRELEDDQYLKMIQAKKEGQLEVSIRIGLVNGADPFLGEITRFFAVDEYRKETMAWNNLRAKAVEKALNQFVYPAFAKEVHEKLLSEAKAFVAISIRENLYEWLNVAPYQVTVDKRDKEEKWEEGPWDLSTGIRVMGIAYEDAWDAPGYAVVVDCYGDIIDSVKLPTLSTVKGLPPGTRVNPTDIDKIVELFRERKPHVIGIAAESRRALDIKDALSRHFSQLRMEQKVTIETPIEILNNHLSMLYQNSEVGRLEFPNFIHIQRQAVSIARRLVDPLLVFAQLFNMDDDILNLNFHPLQGLLSKEEFRNALQVEFVRRVNEVGVDLNECVAHPLTHGNTVQFICGLGPRKAQHLLKNVKQNGVMVSRNQLVMVCRLGPRVFINCAGFIRINVSDLSDTVTGETYIEPLDASRVHPETYDWARKMAVDALEYDDSVDGANPSEALQEILEKPERLKDLDLDAFAEELERQNFGNKRSTLYDIQQELTGPNKDTRKEFVPATEAQTFENIVGEAPSEFREGRLLNVTVINFHFQHMKERRDGDNPKKAAEGEYYCPRCRRRGFLTPANVWEHMPPESRDCPGVMSGIRVTLDNGVTGLIPLKNLSDNNVEFPQERVKLEPAKFFAEFTSRSSDLRDDQNLFKPQKDKHYDHEAEKKAMEREIKKKNKLAPKTNFLKRVIAHPSFKNINYEEAERYLKSVGPGEAVIRPSSKGNNKLTISWKIAEGIHDHIEIVEQDKENAFSLGQKLVIGEEVYDDLDEILARYINPMSMLITEMLKHKYYVDSHGGQPATHMAQRAIVDKWLNEQKSAIPGRIPFCFSAFVAAPKKFFLCFLPNMNVREEFITITPTGYQYRRRIFPTLNAMIKYFKDHFHEPPPVAIGNTPQASVTPGAAMQITPSSGITPRLGGAPNIAALTQAVHTLPAHVWERLKEAGGSASRAGMSATPMAFATPRTPSGASASRQGGSSATPQQTTPSSVTNAPWGRAAQMWQRAMTGTQPDGTTPGTPASVNTPASTNWAAAAAAWVTSGNAPPAQAPDPGNSESTPGTAAAAASAWMKTRVPEPSGTGSEAR